MKICLTVVKPLVKTTEALTNKDINDTNKNITLPIRLVKRPSL